MSNRTMQFVHRDQVRPELRDSKDRRGDFAEIQKPPNQQTLAEQAGRCSQCGIPMCQSHCPLGNNIPDWLQASANGRWREAYELSSATNTLPEVCGRICPQDRLCEGYCVIEKSFKSVTIGSIENQITEKAWAEGWIEPIQPLRESSYKVAIVGSGPGGLAAAVRLREKGHAVTVFERQERPGGLLVFGIPDFKLEKHIVNRRVEWLKKSGVRFLTGVEIGKDLSLSQLRDEYDAVVLATGVYGARGLDFLKNKSPHVWRAFQFLKSNNLAEFGEQPIDSRHIDLKGKTVAVLGGGDTAMDCVRTAVRRNASRVYCIYRRDEKNRSGSFKELEYAKAEGVEFMFLQQPVGLEVEGDALQLRLQRQVLGVEDQDGRRAPTPAQEAPSSLACDVVIEALGFEPEDLTARFGEPKLRLHQKYGTIQLVERSYKTSLEGVFAVGDIVRGASLVVWAVKDGQDCAAEIHQFLSQGKACEPSMNI